MVGAVRAAQEHGLIAVGVNNNTNFVRSMTAGRVVVAGRAIQQGKTQQLWEVSISDDQDRLWRWARSASRTSFLGREPRLRARLRITHLY
jgi:uncharacterized protein (TIGR00369 family)